MLPELGFMIGFYMSALVKGDRRVSVVKGVDELDQAAVDVVDLFGIYFYVRFDACDFDLDPVYVLSCPFGCRLDFGESLVESVLHFRESVIYFDESVLHFGESVLHFDELVLDSREPAVNSREACVGFLLNVDEAFIYFREAGVHQSYQFGKHSVAAIEFGLQPLNKLPGAQAKEHQYPENRGGIHSPFEQRSGDR